MKTATLIVLLVIVCYGVYEDFQTQGSNPWIRGIMTVGHYGTILACVIGATLIALSL